MARGPNDIVGSKGPDLPDSPCLGRLMPPVPTKKGSLSDRIKIAFSELKKQGKFDTESLINPLGWTNGIQILASTFGVPLSIKEREALLEYYLWFLKVLTRGEPGLNEIKSKRLTLLHFLNCGRLPELIALTRSGEVLLFPREVQKAFQSRLISNSPHNIRLLLTILSLYRGVLLTNVKGSPIDTVVQTAEEYTAGTNWTQQSQEEIELGLTKHLADLLRSGSMKDRRIGAIRKAAVGLLGILRNEDLAFRQERAHIRVPVKTGPNGFHPLTYPRDLRALKSSPLFLPLIRTCVSLKFDGLLDSIKALEAQEISLEAKGSKSLAQRSKLHTGKLTQFPDKGGKVRTVGLHDFFSHVTLGSLDRGCRQLLRSFGSADCTYQQGRGLDRSLRELVAGGAVWSYDLTAFTDRFPLSLQKKVLREFLSYSSEESKRLDPNNSQLPEIDVDQLTEDLIAVLGQGREYQHNGLAVKYAVGQSMGLRASWSLATLTHHCMVQYASKLATGKPYFSGRYSLLGDDIVLYNGRLASQYKRLVLGLGVRLSEQKSFVADSERENIPLEGLGGRTVREVRLQGCSPSGEDYFHGVPGDQVVEFASRLLLRQSDSKVWEVTPLTPRLVTQLGSYKEDFVLLSFTDLARKSLSSEGAPLTNLVALTEALTVLPPSTSRDLGEYNLKALTPLTDAQALLLVAVLGFPLLPYMNQLHSISYGSGLQRLLALPETPENLASLKERLDNIELSSVSPLQTLIGGKVDGGLWESLTSRHDLYRRWIEVRVDALDKLVKGTSKLTGEAVLDHMVKNVQTRLAWRGSARLSASTDRDQLRDAFQLGPKDSRAVLRPLLSHLWGIQDLILETRGRLATSKITLMRENPVGKTNAGNPSWFVHDLGGAEFMPDFRSVGSMLTSDVIHLEEEVKMIRVGRLLKQLVQRIKVPKDHPLRNLLNEWKISGQRGSPRKFPGTRTKKA